MRSCSQVGDSMSTRRERLEAKLEKREEWAAKADQRSTARFDAVRRVADNIPLGQPILVGHHSERHARRDQDHIHTGMAKGIEEMNLAKHHTSKAGGLARQLETSIFSDDPDAIEALQAKVASLEAERDAMKAANAAVPKVPLCNYRAEAVIARSRFGGIPLRLRQVEMTKAEYATLHKDYKATYTVSGSHRVRGAMIRHELVYVYLADLKATPVPPPYSTNGTKPYDSWQLTNVGARIRQTKKRIADVERRQHLQTEADASPGGIVCQENLANNWCSVTFAEKPAREILDALRDAGYGWGSGSWSGYLDKLPKIVRELVRRSSC